MDLNEMIFQGWENIGRTLVVGTMAYGTLVLFLRISGKRTLAKLNAFDLVVTVALGSTLSAILLDESIALAEGATALALLISLQFIATFASVRWPFLARAVRSEPTVLARDGTFCRRAMKDQRVTQGEANSAIRAAGASGVEAVDRLILESDGTLSATLKGRSD